MKLWTAPGLVVLVALSAVCWAQQSVDRLGDPLPEGAFQRLGGLRMKYPGGLSEIGYLPDGRGIVSVGGSVHVWNLEKGERESIHRVADSSLGGMKVSRDGTRLLFMTGGDVLVWSLAEERELHRFPTGQKGLTWVTWSPDETRVLTVGHSPPTLKEFELATGEERISIEGDMAMFATAVYGPGAETAFVGGGYDKILAHYDLTTGEKLHEWFTNYSVYRGNMRLSHDEQRLLVGSRSMGTEWLIDGYQELKRFTGHHGGQVTALSYCVNPDEVLTGSRDGSIRRWNRVTGELLLRWVPHESYANNIQVSPDGERVLSYGAGLLAESILETGKPRLSWERHTGAVEAVALMPGGDQVISGSSDATLRLWDASSGECLRTISGAELGAYCAAVSPDGTRVAAGCKDGVLREFRLSDGELLRELRGHLGYVRAVAWSPDGERLVSSADDGSIRVWTGDQDQPVAVLKGHLGGVLAVAVSADGRRVLSGGRDGTVRLWDLATGGELAQVAGHRGWVNAVAFVDPEGRRAVAGGRDGRVIHWDLQTREQLAEMQHGAWLRALAVSADGGTVCSAADDRAVCVWDLAGGELTRRLTGHEAAVNALALSADGRLLVSASSDSTLLVWALQ